MPKKENIQDHLEGKNIGSILSQQYDLVLNGYEIGGGSVRAHKTEILEATYRNMGYDREAMRKSVGHMLNAFQYGGSMFILNKYERILWLLHDRPVQNLFRFAMRCAKFFATYFSCFCPFIYLKGNHIDCFKQN